MFSRSKAAHDERRRVSGARRAIRGDASGGGARACDRALRDVHRAGGRRPAFRRSGSSQSRSHRGRETHDLLSARRALRVRRNPLKLVRRTPSARRRAGRNADASRARSSRRGRGVCVSGTNSAWEHPPERTHYKPGQSIAEARICTCQECVDRACCSGDPETASSADGRARHDARRVRPLCAPRVDCARRGTVRCPRRPECCPGTVSD